MAQMNRNILAVLSDLMFTVKIQEATKRAGFEPVFVRSQQEAIERARQKPALIILDLNDAAVRPLDLIAELKGDPGTRSLPLVGFVSHVQTELRQAAQEQGCDVVLARSAFSQNLPSLLKRYGS
jgi:CheY-like chemotaxis protein